MRVVGIENGEAGGCRGASFERALARDRVRERVGQREGDIRAAVANELEIVDRGGGHFRARADVGQAFVQDFRNPAAVRVEHASGAAGGDRQACLAGATRPARAGSDRHHQPGCNPQGHPESPGNSVTISPYLRDPRPPVKRDMISLL